MAMSQARELALDALQKLVHHHFEDQNLLRCALTHASAVEVSERIGDTYERLEFLGDRVLGLVIAELLLVEFPNEAEGKLARRLNALVRRETCAEIAAALNLGAAMTLGEAEDRSGGRTKETILADMCEALIAALYLDGGFAVSERFIHTYWKPRLTETTTVKRDPKTALQEWSQQAGRDLPEYHLVERTGPDHAPEFTIEVRIDGLRAARGVGSSKRTAEQEAAETLLRREGVWT